MTSVRDTIGVAETGSSRTGVLVAVLEREHRRAAAVAGGRRHIVVEIAPKREQECAKFSYSSKIEHCGVYDGLLDFLVRATTNLRRVTNLVVELRGFEPQLNSILSQVRPDMQMLVWSATWSKEVQSLSKVIQVSVSRIHQSIKANHNVTQKIDADFTGVQVRQGSTCKFGAEGRGDATGSLLTAGAGPEPVQGREGEPAAQGDLGEAVFEEQQILLKILK